VDALTTDRQTQKSLREIGVRIIDDVFIPRDISFFSDTLAFIKLLGLLRAHRYDVVHTYTATPSILGRLAARIVGVKKIFHHQAAWTIFESNNRLMKMIYKKIEYMAVNWSTKSICVSQAVHDQAITYGLAPWNRLITIRNGIDFEPFNFQRNREKLGRKSIIVGTTGRLAKLKDIQSIIQAISLLKISDNTLEYFLEIAGEGEEKEALQKLVRDLNLQKNVNFRGFVQNIPEFLNNIDIFVSASLREGLSVSILEAMAAAKPIVVTNIQPNEELIENEVTGLTTPIYSPEKIAEALTKFITTPKLARTCGRNARKRVAQNFTLDRMFERTLELYTE
jgi:glycosyltransferase involved in cell wall biosynthesis